MFVFDYDKWPWIYLNKEPVQYVSASFQIYIQVCLFVCFPSRCWRDKTFLRCWKRCRGRAHVRSSWLFSRNMAAIMCLRVCTAPSSAAAFTSPARRASSSSGCSTRKVSLLKKIKIKIARKVKIAHVQFYSILFSFIYFVLYHPLSSRCNFLSVESKHNLHADLLALYQVKTKCFISVQLRAENGFD